MQQSRNSIWEFFSLQACRFGQRYAFGGQLQQRAVLFFANVGIDADSWHLTVISEAGGQFLKTGWAVNFLGHGDGKSDWVEVGIQKVALRFRRRGGIIDDANCHTDRLRLGSTLISRTSTNAFQNEAKA